MDKAVNAQYNLSQQLEVANRKALLVDNLEEEILLYKEAVKNVAVEKQR